jgi:hypothetical protein
MIAVYSFARSSFSPAIRSVFPSFFAMPSASSVP